jgi:hypothetical protein
MKTIYKITYPSGKIYIGRHLTDSVSYYGNLHNELVEADFAKVDKRGFRITKEVIWESESASEAEAERKELEYIRLFKSDNPAIGYNQAPAGNPVL